MNSQEYRKGEEMKADLVIRNGKVITVDRGFSIKQAVAVKGDKIIAVGSNEQVKTFIGPGSQVLDLKGKTLLPGINDAHGHPTFFGGIRPPLALDLSYPAVRSIRDMVETLRKKVEALQPGEWIRGFGWDMGFLEECKSDPTRLPRKWDIDSVSHNNPVAFGDFSGHTLLANSKAMELANITKETPDPDGGVIERDPASGEPTGIFKELSAQALVSSVVPLYSKEEKHDAILAALKIFNANGITSFTDAALGPGGEAYSYGVMSADCIDIYKELFNQENLTVRLSILLLFGEYGALSYDDLKKGLETFGIPVSSDNKWIQFPGVKIFADGVPPTKTSWMKEPYVGGGCGSACVPGKTDEDKHNELVRMIVHVHKEGLQLGVHATGDRAIETVVDGFVKGFQEKPSGDPRHYVIHGDFISPETAKTLAKIKCGVSTQPAIKVKIADFMPSMVGDKRAAQQFPMRTVIDAGANLSSSSDAPVTYPNWRQGVQAAVLREGLDSGRVSGPEQCISVEDAIRTYTINGAWQDHMEDMKGSIEVGKLADFCVIGDDILRVDPHRIGDIPVLMTIVGGKIVFDESGGAFS
jgi:predicted amidohydrolase YtcJ